MSNELKTWGDLAERYSLVLFNDCVNLNDGAVLEEWQENHQCEAMEASNHIDDCEVENCKKCNSLKMEYGEEPECNCEVYQ